MWYTQWNLEEGITALYLSHIIDEVSSGTVLDVCNDFSTRSPIPKATALEDAQ